MIVLLTLEVANVKLNPTLMQRDVDPIVNIQLSAGYTVNNV